MEDLDRSQCNHVTQYIRKNCPTIVAQEQKGVGDYALMRVEMRLKHPQRRAVAVTSNGEPERKTSPAELRELVHPLLEMIANGARIAVSSELPPHVVNAIEQLAMTDDGDIRVVARLAAQGDTGKYQAVFARDIPGKSLDEQDMALVVAPCALHLRDYVRDIADIVAGTERTALLRPHGPMVIAEVVAAVRGRKDVTYSMKTTEGGTAIRLEILPQS
jgi:hypothetical protein